MTFNRTHCCVPFCRRRTSKFEPEPPDDLWICPTHWREVPRVMKAVKRRARAALRAAPHDWRVFHRYCRVSARITREAITRGQWN